MVGIVRTTSLPVCADGLDTVTEDLARYMAAVTVNGTSFLAEEPVWAEEFAPNGLRGRTVPVGMRCLTRSTGTLLKVGDTIKRVRIAR